MVSPIASIFRGQKEDYGKTVRHGPLNGTGRRKNRVERLGDGSKKRRRFWRIKITRKLRFTPKKFLVRLRDAYMNFMLRIANTRIIGTGFDGGIDNNAMEFGRRPHKEYEQKMIVEIYKALVAQEQLVTADAARIGSQDSLKVKNRKVACGQYKEEILGQLREMAKLEPNFSDTQGDIDPLMQPGDMYAFFESGTELATIPPCEVIPMD